MSEPEICRICNGTGFKSYYYPLNKQGVCPHCAGMIYLDWITNIIGVRWKVNIPKLTSDEEMRLALWNKRMDLVARYAVKVFEEECIINKFKKVKEEKEEKNTFK